MNLFSKVQVEDRVYQIKKVFLKHTINFKYLNTITYFKYIKVI